MSSKGAFTQSKIIYTIVFVIIVLDKPKILICIGLRCKDTGIALSLYTSYNTI